MTLSVTWLSTLLSSVVALASTDDEVLDRREVLERTMPDLMNRGVIPGMSIALIEDGEPVWSSSYGRDQSMGGSPIDDDTRFGAASLTKPAFAYVVLQLVEEGVLDLDRPLIEILPHPRMQGDYRLSSVTARLILSHQSGWPNWARNAPLRFLFPPGTGFQYSGEGFVYLQLVVEHLEGQPIEAIMQNRLFEPLGMTRSSLVTDASSEENLAWPHDRFGRPQVRPQYSEGNAAYSMLTTAEDYGTFLAAVLNGEGLDESLLEEQWSSQVEVRNGVAWGLGWGLELRESDRLFWHWGDNGGFKCFTIADPQEGVGLVFFTNAFHGLSIAKTLAEIVFPGEHPAFSYISYPDVESRDFKAVGELRRALVSASREDDWNSLLRGEGSNLSQSLEVALGLDLLGDGRSSLAESLLKNVRERQAESSVVISALGELLLARGEEDAARDFFRKASGLEPLDGYASRRLSDLDR